MPDNINQMNFREQRELAISSEEFNVYNRVLLEEFGKEGFYDCEVKGVVFGGDGLTANVWYDDKRMLDFTFRLGKESEVKCLVWIFNLGLLSIKFQLGLLI